MTAPTSSGSVARIVRREPNPYGHRRSDIVDAQLPDGRRVRALCKRNDASDPNSDVAYEAQVYREVLQPLGLSTPAYYGSGVDVHTGEAWILVEYLDGIDDRARGLDDEEAMVLTARWLGAFHAACERRFPAPPEFLRRFDAGHYVELAARAVAEAGPRDRHWLRPLRERLGPFLQPLMERRATIVHTDVYDDNVVIHRGRVCVIDWEMAAVDLGESDLAFLVYGWDDELEAACTAAYCHARWPEGAPEEFGVALRAAKTCLLLHRLTVHPGGRDGWRRRAVALRAVAGELGLIAEAGA